MVPMCHMRFSVANHLARIIGHAAPAALLIAGCLAHATAREALKPSSPAVSTAPPALEDPYLWLEDVTSERSLAWVREQNAISTRELEAFAGFEPIRRGLLAILDSKDKIPYVAKHGAYYYNFWRDEKNVRGLWRRTTLPEYKKASPNWETVLDLDKLAE